MREFFFYFRTNLSAYIRKSLRTYGVNWSEAMNWTVINIQPTDRNYWLSSVDWPTESSSKYPVDCRRWSAVWPRSVSKSEHMRGARRQCIGLPLTIPSPVTDFSVHSAHVLSCKPNCGVSVRNACSIINKSAGSFLQRQKLNAKGVVKHACKCLSVTASRSRIFELFDKFTRQTFDTACRTFVEREIWL